MDDDGAAGLSAFRDSVYIITHRDCSSCHGDNSGLPRHASNNITEAYNAAKLLVDFNNIPISRLVIKIQNGHCGQAVCMTDGAEKSPPFVNAWLCKASARY